MQTVINKINGLVKTLQELLPMNAEHKARLDKKIRLEFNYNSNHIEGNTLTYGETEMLLIFGKTTGNHEWREYEEMKEHDMVFELVQQWATDKERALSETDIKSLHKTILIRPFWKEASTPDRQPTEKEIKVGTYKDSPNHVRLQNGEMFYYASVEDTPVFMGELMDWYKKEEEKKELHPVALAALLHYKFVRIHPFDDGNGRLSRLLMNYVLLKHDLPPVIIKSAGKKEYLFALNLADTGDVNAFVEYIGEQMIWSLELSIRAARGESVDEPGDLEKKLHQLKRKLGENPNDTIQFNYGPEAIQKVVNETVVPLALAWEKKLQPFDVIFITRNMSLSADNISRGFSGPSFDESFEKFCFNFLPATSSSQRTRTLKLQCAPYGLRNIHNQIGLNGGEVTIEFLNNSYEVHYSGNQHPINKLYHQPILPEEIELITEHLGTFLLNNVEQAIEAHKK